MDDRVAGFYVAANPLLPDTFKVGFTEDLRRRLHDSAYVTCWPVDWEYVATFECQGGDLAYQIEQSVLTALSAARVRTPNGRVTELVRATLDDILAAARAAVARMTVAERAKPVYVAPPRSVLDLIFDQDAADVEVADVATTDTVDAVTAVMAVDTMADVAADVVDTVADVVATVVATVDTVVDVARVSLEEGPIVDRPHQAEAVRAIVAELDGGAQSASAVMASRSGKTLVAFRVLQHLVNAGRAKRMIVFVPWLSLMAQTEQKLQQYLRVAGCAWRVVAVSSQNAHGVAAVKAKLKQPLLVICTYQSAHTVLTDGVRAFDVAIFDEAHRTCGPLGWRADGQGYQWSVFALLAHTGLRVSLTATPNYDPKCAINMRVLSPAALGTDGRRALRASPVAAALGREPAASDLYGRCVYRYPLRRAIADGHVVPYRVQVRVRPGAPGATAVDVAAAAAVSKHLLVLFNRTASADALAAECAALLGAEVTCVSLHSGVAAGAHSELLAKFERAPRAILFSVRKFQEGYEFPPLDGVMFASPRHSQRDIAQAVCRPLTLYAGKREAVIHVVISSTGAATEQANDDEDGELPADRDRRFDDIIAVARALKDDDPRVFEWLLNPTSRADALVQVSVSLSGLLDESALIVPALRDASLAMTLSEMRAAARVALLGVASIPWDWAFPQLERCVRGCQRYPKGSDRWYELPDAAVTMTLHSWYKIVVKRYQDYLAGRVPKNAQFVIDPARARQLEALPLWRERGSLEYPYLSDEIVHLLGPIIAANGGQLPPLSVSRPPTEFICFDATPYERISGLLRVVNQQDGAAGLRVRKSIAAALDAVFGGTHWRKGRLPNGKLDPQYVAGEEHAHEARRQYTPIQRANHEFRALAARAKNGDADARAYIDLHFPGYPGKHQRQDHLGADKPP